MWLATGHNQAKNRQLEQGGGLDAFAYRLEERWQCPACGSLSITHRTFWSVFWSFFGKSVHWAGLTDCMITWYIRHAPNRARPNVNDSIICYQGQALQLPISTVADLSLRQLQLSTSQPHPPLTRFSFLSHRWPNVQVRSHQGSLYIRSTSSSLTLSTHCALYGTIDWGHAVVPQYWAKHQYFSTALRRQWAINSLAYRWAQVECRSPVYTRFRSTGSGNIKFSWSVSEYYVMHDYKTNMTRWFQLMRLRVDEVVLSVVQVTFP